MCLDINLGAGHTYPVLSEAYIEALLVDEELADQIWKVRNAGRIDDVDAVLAGWLAMRFSSFTKNGSQTAIE